MSSRVWYCAVVNSDQMAAGQIMAIRKQFAETIEAAGDPEGACLFVVNHSTDGGAECPSTDDARPEEAASVFFSPASVCAIPDLIVVCGAVPSPPPPRDRAELLVGKQGDWDQLPRSSH
jgi:hypothetical protein